MLYIGVDLGTSAVKLLLMDGSGRIHKVVSREYPLYFPHPAWSEQKSVISYQKNIHYFSRIRDGQNRTRRTGLRPPWTA